MNCDLAYSQSPSHQQRHKRGAAEERVTYLDHVFHATVFVLFNDGFHPNERLHLMISDTTQVDGDW